MKKNLKKRHNECKHKLAIAEKVDKTVKSKGFQEIIQPLIDKMVTDIDTRVMSEKTGNIWKQGIDAKPKSIKNNDYYVRLFYYKQALIDLNNRVYGYVASIDTLKKGINELESKAVEPEKKEYGSKYWRE